MDTKNKPTDWREARRLQALQLKAKGYPQNKIAEALGVSAGAVSQWIKKAAEFGAEALRHTPPPGKPARLSCAQKEELVQALLAGPEAYGFEGQLWTSKRVAWLIQYLFGVKYHRAHVSRLLRQELNWTVQKPVELASQRDEAAIEQWKTERWPQLKKTVSAIVSYRPGYPPSEPPACSEISHCPA